VVVLWLKAAEKSITDPGSFCFNVRTVNSLAMSGPLLVDIAHVAYIADLN
jgi:hypothetical protein